MSLGSFLSRAIPVAIGAVSGGPAGALTAFTATEAQKRQERNIKQARNAKETQNMLDYSDFGTNSVSARTQPQRQAPGFFSGARDFFGGVTDIATDIAGGLGSVFDAFGTARAQGQRAGSNIQIAVDRDSGLGRETSQTSQAFAGGIGNLANVASRFLRTPTGAGLTGLAGGFAADMLSGDGKKLRITRKLKSQVRSVFNLTGGDFNATANFLGLSVDQVMFILTKRMRNDGPMVTKAALRKTKTTIRRLKNMCDIYDDMRPNARRKAPMKRATTTRITNVK